MKNLKKCIEMQIRAEKIIPGMTQLLSKRPDRFSSGVWPGYFQKAKGVTIWDLDGNEYTDMSIGGIGATILGYADPDVDGAVTNVISEGVASSLNCPEEVELAELLCDLHPWADKVRFCRAGGEAMAMAVRIARALTSRSKIAFCGYHGWHDWYLSANLKDGTALDGHLINGLEPCGVPKELTGTAIPFYMNDTQDFFKAVNHCGNDLAAVVMEPMRNIEPEPDFMRSIRNYVDKVGAVLIIDEISAGLRFNTGGAHLVMHPVEPDMAVFSKGLGNGYAISAVIGRDSVMEAAQNSFISSTNWTERIGPVAALATLQKHSEKKVFEHLIAMGDTVQQGWIEAAGRFGLPIDVGGMKPMSHFKINVPEWPQVKAYFIQEMLKKGFLASNLFYAMYAHSSDHVKEYFLALNIVFEGIKKALSERNIDKLLVGEKPSDGFSRLN
ncbi:MAG: aminotransferase class III-fold pyridoxal phosphate-dependent enzyme [Desulfobacteraceae bacterium]|nr:aminotransferase class III-fold pyridoxal phosphate-dependent enzyme [Desulfobacteraceae bacterium]